MIQQLSLIPDLVPNREPETKEAWFPVCEPDYYCHSCPECIGEYPSMIAERVTCPFCEMPIIGWVRCSDWWTMSEQCEGMQSDEGEAKMNWLIAQYLEANE